MYSASYPLIDATSSSDSIYQKELLASINGNKTYSVHVAHHF